MAETTPEQNLFKLSLDPLQDYLGIDIGQVNGNGLEVERFCEKNGILDHLDATHKIDILKRLIHCLRRLYQQSITCSQLSSFQIISLRNQLSVPDKSEKTNDIHSLANIYCSVLTNRKWQNYSEELPMEDIQCSDPDIALDILWVMTKDSTTNVKDVFLHPFFLGDFRKVYFICSAFEFINSKLGKLNEAEKKSMLQSFNMHEVEDVIPDKGWIASLKLTSNEIRYISKNNKDLQINQNVISKLAWKVAPEKKNSMLELMRFFRNRYIHNHGDENDIKIVFGGYPTGYWRFFTSRFPNLFMHVYRNMKIYVQQDTNLERYFLNDSTTLNKSFHNSEAEGKPVKKASRDVLPSINQRWTQIKDTAIWYDQANRYRKGSKVFDAIRKSGAEDQEAVVKFVTDFNIEEKEIIKKLKREIDNHLDTHFHENVVTYFQSGDCKYKKEDAFFILMEKCDRKTLYERIKKENLPYIERAKTVKCIAQGLQHLRGRNILHRDLKPQNILYKGDVPVISDFGLSKKISPDKSHTHQSLEFCGTAGWGAPETYSKNAKISFAADIYSAGLVFFFALTNGKHPYGDDPGSWHAYIKDDKDCNLKPLYDTPNGEVAYDLISLMLGKDPEHRPTIEEVLKHPFFWDVPTKKYFYYDICSIIEFHNEKKTGSRIFSSETAKYLKEVGTESKNWKDKLPLTDAEENNIKDNFWRREREEITVHNDVIQGFAKQLPDSVTSMVCFTRNRFEYSGEDKRKGKIDLTDEELWKFFNSRYPYLFIYTYYASKEYDETKPAIDTDKLAKYF